MMSSTCLYDDEGYSLQTSVIHRFKRDAIPLLLFIITLIIMSYPFVFQIGDRLPFSNIDTHHALWQNWWTLQAFENGFDVNVTDLMFAPTGLDMTLLPPRLPNFVIWTPLYYLFGEPLAYNLTALLTVMIKAYGMYLFGLYLFNNRIAAWVSGAFYAFGSMSLQLALQQPLTGGTEWIPYFMLAFVYGLDQLRQKHTTKQNLLIFALAAFFFSLSVLNNLKIGIFAMLIGGAYVLFIFVWHRLWQYRQFWMRMTVFGVLVLVFISPIFVPVIQSSNFESAVDSRLEDEPINALRFIKVDFDRPLNYINAIAMMNDDRAQFRSAHLRTPIIGIVSLVFAAMGVVYAIRVDRRVFIWVFLAIFFFWMSLGSQVRIGYQTFDHSFSLLEVFKDNFIVVVIRWTYRFAMIFWFAFAILIGYGLLYRLRSLTLNRNQWFALVMSVVALLLGTSLFPISMHDYPKPNHISVLNTLPEGSVVNIPMGRTPSKYYMSLQPQHRRPMIEGMMARMPDDAYDYIESIPALQVIRQEEPIWTDLSVAEEEWEASMQQLLDDGFRYIILHKEIWISYKSKVNSFLLERFEGMPALYEGDDAFIYDIEVLLTQTPTLGDSE